MPKRDDRHPHPFHMGVLPADEPITWGLISVCVCGGGGGGNKSGSLWYLTTLQLRKCNPLLLDIHMLYCVQFFYYKP